MPQGVQQRWLALWAAMLGYMLDSMDVLLYVFAVQTLRDQFHWSASTAGLVSSATLITSAFGGIVAGIVADRIGRTRALVYAILLYSLGSAGSATSRERSTSCVKNSRPSSSRSHRSCWQSRGLA